VTVRRIGRSRLPIERTRVITPYEAHLVADRWKRDRFVVVWEKATIEWGLPLGAIGGGVALCLGHAIVVDALVCIAVVTLAYGVGRLLWALGLRPRRARE
jgi:hypothetical protein